MEKPDDPVEAARILATTAWRRDFERSTELQRQVHDEEVAKFLAALKGEFGRIPGNLHDEHGLSPSEDWKTLMLTEGRHQILISCHINTEKTGYLHFQYSWGLEEKSKKTIRLVRQGKDAYVWYDGRKALQSVAKLCLAQLFNHANSHIAADVRFNPSY